MLQVDSHVDERIGDLAIPLKSARNGALTKRIETTRKERCFLLQGLIAKATIL